MTGYLLILIIGILPIVFGAGMVIFRPNTPGGIVKLFGQEVSSPGDGLVLIVVGLGAAAWAAPNLPPGLVLSGGFSQAGPSNPVAGGTLAPSSGPLAQTTATAPATATSVPTVKAAVVPATCTPTPATGEFALKDQPGESYHELGVIYPGEEATVERWSYATDVPTAGGDPWLFVEVTQPRDGRKGWIFTRESNGARPDCNFDLSTPSRFPFAAPP